MTDLTDRVRPRRPSRIARRPAEAWVLALLFAGGAVRCLGGAASSMSDRSPAEVDYAVGALCAVVAVLLWRAAARGTVRTSVRHALLGLAITLDCLLVAVTRTPQGEVVNAFALLWVAVYAAHFFRRREACLHAGLISVGFGVGLLLNDAPTVPSAYVVVTLTIWVAVGVLTDVTTRLRSQAATDQLTGLQNRAGLRAAAEREHALAVRTGAPLAVCVIDLDGFKVVNDRHGHAAGDTLLVELATAWRTRLRRCDLLGRQGGDEFVLVLPATTAEQAGVALARLRVDNPIEWSAGVAEWGPGESYETCLARADRDLYAAKSRRPAEVPLVPEPRRQQARTSVRG
jgi:diguanylate cyclase (GGDEF)-like protein